MRTALAVLWVMAWFLHAVENRDGRWTCRRGHAHEHVDGAIAHLSDFVRDLEGAFQLVLHFYDGTVRTLDVGR